MSNWLKIEFISILTFSSREDSELTVGEGRSVNATGVEIVSLKNRVYELKQACEV